MSNHLISSASINSDYEYQYIMLLREQHNFDDSSGTIDLDRFEASVFRDPEVLALYKGYEASIREGQHMLRHSLFGNSDSGEALISNQVNSGKFLHFMFPAAYGSEKDTYHHATAVIDPIKLDAGLLDKVLIGSGRAFVNTGQGIKQFGLAIGEKLNFVEPGSVARYTSDINSERDLYKQTLVGQSAVAKTGEILADIAMYTVVPGGSGAKGARFVAGSAMAGGIIGGMQATEDGSLGSRVENAAFGAVEGAVGGYVVNKTAQGVHWVWKEGKVQYGLYNFDRKAVVPHVFSKAKGGKFPKSGHVLDTPENRRIIVETYMDKKNFIGEDIHGKKIFAKLLPDKTEAWVEIQKGKLKSAGINKIPKHYSLDGSLIKNNHITYDRPKP